MPPLKARIDLSAFRHNLKTIRKIVGKNIGILPVIKADAYGHGLLPIAREALKLGVPVLAVSYLEEGIRLRRAKIASPILLVDGILKEEIPEAVKYRLTPIIFSLDIATELNRFAGRAGKLLAVHLKLDTGMSRLGFPFQESREVLKKIKRLKNLQVEGIMTHLASSPNMDSPQTELQLSRFDKIISLAREEGFKPKWTHAANSGAIINFPNARYNMVRPGLLLYGIPPCPVRGVTFKPVMTVSSRIISVKSVSSGEGIGYNATYIMPRTKKIGVVIGGYANGINRHLSNCGAVLWREKVLPIIGNVCMDNFIIDLSRAQSARPGDEVILLGPQHEKISAKRLADLCDTIPYEILCSYGNKAEKVFG